MECLFVPDWNGTAQQLLQISDEETQHCRALRLRHHEKIQVTNGRGALGTAVLVNMPHKKGLASVQVVSIEHDIAPRDKKFILALGILENRDRFEFALEKATELGVTHFVPLITDYSSNKSYVVERLNNKIISACKQSKRSNFPSVIEKTALNDLKDCLQNFDGDWDVVVGDCEGVPFEKINPEKNYCVVIGPEGGFSEREIQFLKNNFTTKLCKVSPNRLRAETAAVSVVSIVSQYFFAV